MASYPFDDSASHLQQDFYSQSEDDSLFRYLALVYSQNHPAMKTGQPNCPGSPGETFKDGITNGAYWYDVPGEWLSSSAVHVKMFKINLTVKVHCSMISVMSGN